MTVKETAGALGSISCTSAENQVIADLAKEAAQREVFTIVPGEKLGLVVGGDLREFDIEDYEPTPRRQTGKVTLTDQDSFVLYVNRHRDDHRTTLWTNVDNGTVTGVINDHCMDGGDAGWGDHRATLQLKLTEDWRFWIGQDNQMISQVAFAEHLEQGARNVVTPAAADMLEIAQTFHAKRNVAFKSSSRLKSGEIGLQYETTDQATAGIKGTMEIPDLFTLRLQPFDGGPEYDNITARFRYRIVDGVLFLGYQIDRPDLVKRAAFNDITAKVSEGIQLPVMAGVPRN